MHGLLSNLSISQNQSPTENNDLGINIKSIKTEINSRQKRITFFLKDMRAANGRHSAYRRFELRLLFFTLAWKISNRYFLF